MTTPLRCRRNAIADEDIHGACLAVTASADLSEERGSALFKAALAAIRSAEQRHAGVKEKEGPGKEE
jgi:hypothetical protein